METAVTVAIPENELFQLTVPPTGEMVPAVDSGVNVKEITSSI